MECEGDRLNIPFVPFREFWHVPHYSESIEELKQKAKTGDEEAIRKYALRLPLYSKARLKWTAKLQNKDACDLFFDWITNSFLQLDKKTMYAIGKIFKSHDCVTQFTNMYNKRVQESYVWDGNGVGRNWKKVETAQSLVDFYHEANRIAFARLCAWSVCGLRLGICKDMRIYISKAVRMTEFFV